jgi:hypothetical protein
MWSGVYLSEDEIVERNKRPRVGRSDSYGPEANRADSKSAAAELEAENQRLRQRIKELEKDDRA